MPRAGFVLHAEAFVVHDPLAADEQERLRRRHGGVYQQLCRLSGHVLALVRRDDHLREGVTNEQNIQLCDTPELNEDSFSQISYPKKTENIYYLPSLDHLAGGIGLLLLGTCHVKVVHATLILATLLVQHSEYERKPSSFL